MRYLQTRFTREILDPYFEETAGVELHIEGDGQITGHSILTMDSPNKEDFEQWIAKKVEERSCSGSLYWAQ